MTVNANAAIKPRTTPLASGALYIDRQKAKVADFPTLANGDSIQIGVVPAGTKLVEHLCRLQIPKLDSNGNPTGKYKIGTEATIDALVAEANASAAVTDLQPQFKAVEIGSADEDTPIYLTLSAALATQATAGEVVFDVALRAYDAAVDA